MIICVFNNGIFGETVAISIIIFSTARICFSGGIIPVCVDRHDDPDDAEL